MLPDAEAKGFLEIAQAGRLGYEPTKESGENVTAPPLRQAGMTGRIDKDLAFC